MFTNNKILTVLTVFLLSMFAAATAQTGQAQSAPVGRGPSPLRAEQFKINRLASDQSSDQATFTIDNASVIQIEIISNIGTIQTSIVTPSGNIITPGNVAGSSGEFVTHGGAAISNGSLIIPSLTANFHYIYTFPSQGAGNYIVRFQAPNNLSDEVAILTNATWDSPIAAKLLVTEPVIRINNPSILTAALFKGTEAISGATVEVTVIDPAGNKTTLGLLDNGASGTDDKTDDGLYSGEFTPGAAGRYSILARMSGAASDGTQFVRNSVARLEAFAPKGQLSGSISDQGVDDNADGLTDRIAFTVGAQVATPGTYHAFVHLKTSGGKTLVGSGATVLPNGPGTIEANVSADAVRAANENGPYTIELVELDYLDEKQGSEDADRRRDLGQTAAYLVTQFQRKPLILTGVFTEQGIDTNGNNKFDRLRVTIQVDVLVAGAYEWTLKLSDQGFAQIDTVGGGGSLGSGLQNITVEFDGAKIGAAGIPGPYMINDLLLFGPRSLVTTEVGQTRAYLPEQFEGGQPSAVSFTLAPQSAPNLRIGSSHTLTATITDNNSPVANQEVTFLVIDGPNTGRQFTARTNGQGVATASYTSQTTGTDTIEAAFVNVEGRTRLSNRISATWIENITVELTPPTTTLFTGANASLMATVLSSNNPVPNLQVSFNIISGPNAGKQIIARTNAQGVATASYTGTLGGTDTVQVNTTVGTTPIPSNTVTVLWISNRPPVCANVVPSFSLITPPDRRFVAVSIQGVFDPDNDPLSISVTSVRQDEPVDHVGDASHLFDAIISGATAQLRAESIIGSVTVSNTQVIGNGRYYHVGFTARDPQGLTCSGTVKVGVPHVRNATPIDDGPTFSSTSASP